MSGADQGPEEAITEEEIHGGQPPAKRPKQNAFEALMAPKPKSSPPKPAQGHRPGFLDPVQSFFSGRLGLGEYLADPSSFPSSVVIYHTEDFVAIHDRFPKATVHTLLLPRSSKYNLSHPFEAFEDAEFLAKVKIEVEKLKGLVAKELQRRLGKYSAADKAREAILDGEAEPPSNGALPAGRDWESEIISGVHAVPSMSHLHIHVLSRDMHSPQLRHRKHYNSFATPFLVDVADFPLPADDPRRDTREHPFLRQDMKCWRCGQGFGDRFKRLKEHLEEEFEVWRRI